MDAAASLIAEWEDLLARRPAFRDSLGLYGAVLEAWGRWSPEGSPVLRWGPEHCRERWERGVSLIVEAPPTFDREALEPLFAPLLEELAALGEEEGEALSRFAAAWDEGRFAPRELLPGLQKEGGRALSETLGISPDLVNFVTYLGLRPPLETYFAEARAAFSPDLWDAGACPFCTGAPSFGDIGEDGKRWLCCALCGGRWTIGRLRCPFCDNRDAKTLTRLAAEDQEEGYLVEACDLCRGYLKGVDRRTRWNAASALIEDWGTPHLDLIARRRGYWRATPSLIQLAPPLDEA
ncbi:MAG: formate dehydrogenase accessory protein FdhE [Candidatus Rokubacteria bacterium]|nr:formate dehydrogenase accessory protein FdhE [Candidatus Rokubacteria bacterium]